MRLNTTALKWLVVALITLIFVLRGDARFWYPQLWFEDTSIYLQDAYNLSFWDSITKPHVAPSLGTGYYVVTNRVLAEVALLFRLEYLPTIFLIIALICAIGCCSFFLMDHFAWLIPSLWVRSTICVLFALLPGSYEILLRFLNMQWYMGILSFLMVLMYTPYTTLGRIIYIGGWLLLMLSNPQTVIFLPCLLVKALLSNKGQLVILASCIAIAIGLLPTIIYNTLAGGTHFPLPTIGQLIPALINSFVMRVLVAATIGATRSYGWFFEQSTALLGYLWYIPFAVFLSLLLVPLVRKQRWRHLLVSIYCLYCMTIPILLAMLRQPQLVEASQHINTSWGGERYFVLPVAAFCFLLIWWGVQLLVQARWSKLVQIATFLAILSAVQSDFFDPYVVTDQQWSSQVARIVMAEQAAYGEQLRIPSNPSSIWSAVLNMPTSVPELPRTTEQWPGTFEYAGSDITNSPEVKQDEVVLVRGWALNRERTGPVDEVLILNTHSGVILGRTRSRTPRSDVIGVTGPVRWSGWQMVFRADQLPPGEYTLQAFVRSDADLRLFPIANKVTVLIKPTT
jgi:hypothetical protein